MNKENEKQPTTQSVNMWKYPKFDGYPSNGSNCLLLTIGGGTTIGFWTDDSFIAWADFPKRDRTKEPTIYYERYGTKNIK